ncbi:MAG TPA: hypothetical protein VIW24_20125 [Aldersonia sp.]
MSRPSPDSVGAVLVAAPAVADPDYEVWRRLAPAEAHSKLVALTGTEEDARRWEQAICGQLVKDNLSITSNPTEVFAGTDEVSAGIVKFSVMAECPERA